MNLRSVREIQNELDAINNYLQANQDTFVPFSSLITFSFSYFSAEVRRELINKYRVKRDAAREYKQIYERCCQQIDVKYSLEEFS